MAPDINDPADGNKIATPENPHTGPTVYEDPDAPKETSKKVSKEKTPKKEKGPKVTSKPAPQEFTAAVPATKTTPEIPPKPIKK